MGSTVRETDGPRAVAPERGSASAQVVLATPAVLLLMMLVFQFALWQHATHVATAAAQRGVRSAQVENGSPTSGRRAAGKFLATRGSGLLRSPVVEVSRDVDRARARVEATVVSLLPGFHLSVKGVADGPTERFRARTER